LSLVSRSVSLYVALLATLIATLPACGQQVDPAQAISLDQAQRLAGAHNPQILAANQTVTSAQLNLKSERAPINPTVGYSGLNNTVGSTDLSALDNSSNYVGYVTLETNGAQHWRTSAARAGLKGAGYDAIAIRLAVKQAVADAYSGLQVANSLLENEEAVYKMVQQLRDLSEKQFQLGAAPETNAVRSEIALTQEQQNLIGAQSAVLTARANLNMQLGQDAGQSIDADPLSYTPARIPSYEQLVHEALSNRPEIQAGAAAKWAADAAVGMESSEYYPDLIVGKSFDSSAAQVGFTMPLDLGNITQGVRKARSDVKVQEDQNESEREQVSLDVKSAYIAITQAEAIMTSYEQPDGIMSRSQTLVDQITKGYALGANTILDVINAQQTYRATRNNYYAAMGSYNQAVDQMDRAVGGDFTSPGPLTWK